MFLPEKVGIGLSAYAFSPEPVPHSDTMLRKIGGTITYRTNPNLTVQMRVSGSKNGLERTRAEVEFRLIGAL